MAAWPSSIPTPIARGIGIAPEQGFLRTDMEAGAARQRRKSTAVPVRFSIRCVFSRLDMDIFQAWWHHEIQEGAAWFTMPTPSGRGITLQEARFVAPYESSTIDGDGFEVSGTVEIRAMPTMSAGELAPYL